MPRRGYRARGGNAQRGRQGKRRARKQNSNRQSGFERQPGSQSGSVANPVQTLHSLNLFGLRTRKMLRYQESTQIAGGTSSTANSYVLSANGAFDPNISGGGHQPMGFDQMMVFYNHYTVVRSRIKVVFANLGLNTCRVGLTLSGSTTVITSYNTLLENGNITFASVTPSNVMGSNVILRASHSPGNFQGLDDIMDDSDMRGDAASNPTEQSYYHLYVWDPANSSAPLVVADVIIEFDVVFHEPKKVTGS